MFVHLVSKPECLSINNFIEIKTSKVGTKLGKKEITFTENVNEGQVKVGFQEHWQPRTVSGVNISPREQTSPN